MSASATKKAFSDQQSYASGFQQQSKKTLKYVRTSQPAEMARKAADSPNSIFEQIAFKQNSAVSGTEVKVPHATRAESGIVTFSKDQDDREDQPEPYFNKQKTLREILDGLDKQEPDLEFLNQNPWKAQGSSPNDEVRLYEQYCVQGGTAANHLRATQDYDDAGTTATKKKQQTPNNQTKPSMNQNVLQTYKQNSEGVLYSSQDQTILNIAANQQNLTPMQHQKSGQVNILVQEDMTGELNRNPGIFSSQQPTVLSTPSKQQWRDELCYTEQGILKRVMRDKINKQLHTPSHDRGLIQAQSFSNTIRAQLDTKDAPLLHQVHVHSKDVLQSQNTERTGPDDYDERGTDFEKLLENKLVNSNVKVHDSSNLSAMVNVENNRQKDQDGFDDQSQMENSKHNKNCYLLLPWSDIQLIINSINDDSDQLKLYFACKALKSIMMVSSSALTKQILDKHGKRLLKRLIIVLSYEHLPDAMLEALHILVLITNLMDYEVTSELIVVGLIHQLNKFVDIKFLQLCSCKQAAERALQIVANVTQISNLAIFHLTKEYVPDRVKVNEGTLPGLNFLDRIVTMCRMTAGGKLDGGGDNVAMTDIVKTQNSIRLSFESTQMADLRVQLAYIGKHILCRMQELDAVNLGKAVTLLLEVIVQSNHQVSNVSPHERQQMIKNLKLIWLSVMSSLRMICGQSELACAVLNKNPYRQDFAKSLISIADFCVIYGHRDKELVPLLMDTLVVLGDLTASDSFQEIVLFIDNNLFSVLKNALESATISSLENFNMSSGHTDLSSPVDAEKTSLFSPDLDLSELTKAKFQATIVWTVSNAVADEPACQQSLLNVHTKLMDMCFALVDCKSVMQGNIKSDIIYLIDNLFMAMPMIKRHLFDDSPQNSRFMTFVDIFKKFLLDSELTESEGSGDTHEYLSLKNLTRLLRMDKKKKLVLKAIVGRDGRQGMPDLIESIYRMQHHHSTRVYEKALLLANKYLVGHLGRNLPVLTDIYDDLCQHNIDEPDKDDVLLATVHISAQAKRRARRRQSDASVDDGDNSAAEEARNKAAMFLMTAAEKRGFEKRKHEEKSFNQKFKRILSAIVSSYLARQDPSNKVIDMACEKKRTNSMSQQVSLLSGEQINLETTDNKSRLIACIPKSLLKYDEWLKLWVEKQKKIAEQKAQQELQRELDEQETEKATSGKGKDESKPRSLRSQLMRKAAAEDENSPSRFRNVGSHATEDVGCKSSNKLKVQPVAINNSKHTSLKTDKDKDYQKSAMKDKRSTATLKPEKPTLMTKSNRTGGTDTLGTGSGNLRASKVGMNSRLSSKKGSATVRGNKVLSFNVP